MAARGRGEEIEEILVDTWNEDEQIAAWEVAFQDRVALPFAATILGVPVEVREFRSKGYHVECLAAGGGRQRWVGVESLDPDALPADFVHVLDLYRSWQGRE